jgi:hypothetical protein
VSALGDHRADLAARLAAGAPPVVTVTTNPAAGPPVILVDLITLTAASGIGATAAALLETMAEHVLVTLGFAVLVPRQSGPTVDSQLPTYELTYPVQIPNPNC